MDFVVLGFGLGALAVLLGLAVRDLGPFARRLPRDGAMPWSEVAARVAWGRVCRAGGLVLAIAGAALCLLTGVGLLARLSDGTGMRVVLGGIVLALLGFGGWIVRYRMGPGASADGSEASGRAAPSGRSPVRGGRGVRGVVAEAKRRPVGGVPVAQPSENQPGEQTGQGTRSGRQVPDGGPPMGALTVDAMGGLRRSPVAMPADDGDPAPEPNARSSEGVRSGAPPGAAEGRERPTRPPGRMDRMR